VAIVAEIGKSRKTRSSRVDLVDYFKKFGKENVLLLFGKGSEQ